MKIIVKFVLLILALFAVSGAAMAAGGVDTSTSSLNSIDQWFRTWIPLGATLLLAGCFLAWFAHLIRVDFFVRAAIALIGIGSSSYLVSLFGL